MAPQDIKVMTVRGAVVSVGSQAVALCLRTGAIVVMSRLLKPDDFGLVGMVTAFTGFLHLFRDVGLSLATIQREDVTDGERSALFWVNAAVGLALSLLTAALAPVVALFYQEPRLTWVGVALSIGFIVNGAAVQHRAMLQREMRFGTLSAIETIALVGSVALGIGAALLQTGYWSLVVMSLALASLGSLGVWLASGWVPDWPRRVSSIGPLLRYGGTVTVNNVIVYLSYNADKVLLGRRWGPHALGIYARAQQILTLPTDTLNAAIGAVAFPAIARVHADPERLRRYFLGGYRLFLSLTVPIPIAGALFADDIIRVLLGPGWDAGVNILRLLAPSILVWSLINPFGWLLQASGRSGRSLGIAFVIAPVVLMAYVLGLPGEGEGMAAGLSAAMVLLVAPVVLWAKRGTAIGWGDLARACFPAALSVLVGVVAVTAVHGVLEAIDSPLRRLGAGMLVLLGVYSVTLLFSLREILVYSALLREMGAGSARR